MENTKLRASQKYKKRSTFDSIWRQLRKNKGAIVGMILLVVIIIIALVSPYIFNYETDVIANNVKERMRIRRADTGSAPTIWAAISSRVSAMVRVTLWRSVSWPLRRARRGRHARRGSGLCRRRV